MQVESFIQSARGAARAGFLALALALVATAPGAIAAGEATPVAPDAALEERVQALSHTLRCLVCQNQTIADSNAPLAIDLRNQVREQLAAGKNESEVREYMVARYGDFVLYRPRLSAMTAMLWFGPAALLVASLAWLFMRLRRRETEPVEHLSPTEHSQALALLKGDTQSPQEPRS